LQFILERDGTQVALDFARRTLASYRAAVLCSVKHQAAKPHFASTPDYRRGFIQSYLGFKAFIAVHTLGERLLDKVLARYGCPAALDAAGLQSALLGIEADFDALGPYAFAKKFGVLVNNSGEEFAIAFMDAFNRHVRAGTY
jgi:pimeloyl-ACP methyl ester carboxylesterase